MIQRKLTADFSRKKSEKFFKYGFLHKKKIHKFLDKKTEIFLG